MVLYNHREEPRNKRKEVITMNKETMIREYRKLDASDKYILGLVIDHMVYAVIVDRLFPRYMTYEQASRNQGHNLRLRIKAGYRRQLLNRGAWVLGDESILKGEWNRGEMFEKAVTEYYGQHWEKDTLSFADGSDLIVDGIGYQIKLDTATIVNEKTLIRQRALKKVR